MKRRMKIGIGLGSLVFMTTITNGSFGYVGQDPILLPQCTLTQITGAYGPDGSIRYSLTGTCNNQPITGQVGYSSNRQMAEKFFYRGAQITTTATCPADPWVSGAPCENSNIAAKGADPGPLLQHRVPLSLGVGNESVTVGLFQQAKTNASRPKPPGPPINARAKMTTPRSATISWLGPAQQGNFGPYLNFIVEARPRNTEGAAWTKVGGIGRHTAPDYQLTVKLPTTSNIETAWDVRACATTVFASTCTNPISPTLAPIVERLSPAIEKAKQVPQGKTTIDAALPLTKPHIGASGTEESAVGQPPSERFKSLRTAPSSIPGNNSALNPQPLPPKALTAPPVQQPRSFSGTIMRRGLSEDETKEEPPTSETDHTP